MSPSAAGLEAATLPLCRDPALAVPVRAMLARAVDLVRARLPADDLVALVLTGSFARGEGSVLPVPGGHRVLGDVEFVVVLRRAARHRVLRGALGRLGREASAAVAGDGLQVQLEFGPLDVDFLRRRARPSIFFHDLVHHGKVVWGPPDLLRQARPCAAGDIPRDDALCLLLNRTVEQLETAGRLEDLEADAVPDLAYQHTKLVLDLAGSALAFSGRHTASYEERPRAFDRLLAGAPGLAARLPAGFPEALEAAVRAKLEPAASGVFPPPPASLEEHRRRLTAGVAASAGLVAAFLAWELEVLLGVRGPLPVLLARYLAAQSWYGRARGWAKVALHPLPPPLPLSARRAVRLLARSTPRALLHVAAVQTLLGGAGPEVDRLLPLAHAARPRTPAARRAAVVALWRWCVRND